jgi:hypothetical protein
MRDRVCPIEECTATVRFEEVVVEVTPRYRLHDLGEVDEFATCPECDSAVAGFYPENDADRGEVELILDIDDEDEAAGNEAVDGSDGAGEAVADDGSAGAVDGSGFDAPSDDFDAPDDVLAAGDGDAGAGGGRSDGDDAKGDDEDGDEPVFGSGEDE